MSFFTPEVTEAAATAALNAPGGLGSAPALQGFGTMGFAGGGPSMSKAAGGAPPFFPPLVVQHEPAAQVPGQGSSNGGGVPSNPLGGPLAAGFSPSVAAAPGQP